MEFIRDNYIDDGTKQEFLSDSFHLSGTDFRRGSYSESPIRGLGVPK